MNTYPDKVLKRISEAEHKISVKKCALHQKNVKYLGHCVTTDGISADEDKIRAVKNWPRPKNLHELCSFLGIALTMICTEYQ